MVSEPTFAELFATMLKRAMSNAYSGNPPAWLPLTRRTDPTIGRKRRARRARGKRIEARRNPPYNIGGRVWLASAVRSWQIKPIGPTTRLGNAEIQTCIDTFLDPSMGEPWGDQPHA